MNNWKTTLGGSLSALGTSLAGCATIGAFTLPEYKTLALWCVLGGALLSALGKFFGMLFAADAPSATSTTIASGKAAGLLIMLSLILPLAFVPVMTSCTTNQQKIAYNTLYSVEKTTTAAHGRSPMRTL